MHNRSNQSYPYADMKECVQLAVGCFGKERVMWGTGYPDSAHRLASVRTTPDKTINQLRHAFPR